MDSYDVKFDFVRFLKFLKDNNVMSVAIAAILSDRINELTNTFVNSLLMPIINRDGDGDGERDIKVIEDMSCTFLGAKLEVGKFVMSLLRFFIITYMVFIICKIMCGPKQRFQMIGFNTYFSELE